jgi:hypothetical protein
MDLTGIFITYQLIFCHAYLASEGDVTEECNLIKEKIPLLVQEGLGVVRCQIESSLE